MNQLLQVLLPERVRVAVVEVVRLLDGLAVEPVRQLERLGGLPAQPVELDPLQLVQLGADRRVDHVQLIGHRARLWTGESRSGQGGSASSAGAVERVWGRACLRSGRSRL